MSAGEQEGIISIIAVLLVAIDCMMRYPLSTSLDVYNIIVLGMRCCESFYYISAVIL